MWWRGGSVRVVAGGGGVGAVPAGSEDGAAVVVGAVTTGSAGGGNDVAPAVGDVVASGAEGIRPGCGGTGGDVAGVDDVRGWAARCAR